MSDIINAKKQPRTCLHIPDETFQALFKEARNQRVTVTEYILNVLNKEATNLNKGKWSHYHHSSAVSAITIKDKISNDNKWWSICQGSYVDSENKPRQRA